MIPNNVKVIIFDLGNVILPFDFDLCCRNLSRCSPFPLEDIRAFLLKEQLISDYEEGKMDSAQFFAYVQKELSLGLTFEQFRPIWGNIFNEDCQVSGLIRRLRPDYRLLLLSNTNELHFEYILGRYSVMNQFDEYILSYKVGYAKPHPRIYQEAILQAGVSPGQIVYTDDRLEFIQAACKLGIQGIHFIDAAQLERRLIQYGVFGE